MSLLPRFKSVLVILGVSLLVPLSTAHAENTILPSNTALQITSDTELTTTLSGAGLVNTNEDFTIELFVNIEAYSDSYILTTYPGSTSTEELFLSIDETGTVYFLVNKEGNPVGDVVKSTTKLPLNTWHHVAVIRQNKELAMAINGIIEDTIDVPDSKYFPQPDNIAIAPLPDTAPSKTKFRGSLDGLRFSSIARYTVAHPFPINFNHYAMDSSTYWQWTFENNTTDPQLHQELIGTHTGPGTPSFVPGPQVNTGLDLHLYVPYRTHREDGESMGMSALAYKLGEPVYSDVEYEWGISSTYTIGTLNVSTGDIATFTPLHAGTGDLFVTARHDDEIVVKSVRLEVQESLRVLKGDVDRDGRVDVLDLTQLLAGFGTSNRSLDFDGNRIVNISDLAILLANFGTQI